jgi:hypothetical protein
MSSELPEGIHMPQPSFWPITLAISVLLLISGVLTSWVISVLGALLLIAAIVGWALENRKDEEGAHFDV